VRFLLKSLQIKNIALIDSLNINFTTGMNCLTGETGAGKSIIIDSISCILGARMSRDSIRTGYDTASVEGVFICDEKFSSHYFNELGIEPIEDGTLTIFREFNAFGKNVCRINNHAANLSTLKQLGEILVDIHGQHDNQSLLREESHINLLDMFGGDEIQKKLSQYKQKLSEYNETKRIIKNISGDPQERERKIELLKYQVDEINKANLCENEDVELENRRLVLANSEKIILALNNAYELIADQEEGNSILDMMTIVSDSLSSIEHINEKYRDCASRIDEMRYLIEDISEVLRKERDEAFYDPAQLEEIEDRLDVISKLKRKYGNTISEILEFSCKAENDLENYQGSEENILKLNEQKSRIKKELLDFCDELNLLRNKVAKVLESSICSELTDLEMNNAKFEVNIQNLSDELNLNFTKTGLDEVEFLISPNKGEPVKSLSRIASGGELSRIMLAIKTILANVDSIPTMIFDEIDIGISGVAAKKVGEKMRSVSKTHQVICVTHLAQIAAISENNIYVSKFYDGKSTITVAKQLNYNDKVNEIARLLDGDSSSEITVQHAKEMIKKCEDGVCK